MANPHPYRVVAIEPGKAPRLAEQGEWFRYVIANGKTRVVGRRCGTREHVRSHAGHLSENLNERARTGRYARAPRPGRKAQRKEIA